MRFIKEAYLDSEEKFFDYGTQEINGKDIFDTSKTGFSYYDNFLNDKDLEYMKKSKGLTGRIEYMTPGDYFKYTGRFFNRSPQSDYESVIEDKETISHLKDVILKYKRKFPLTYLNFSNNQQEGRHRMAVAAELFGWNEKFPVLVITNYN